MSKYAKDIDSVECPYCQNILDLGDESTYYDDNEAQPVSCDECNGEFFLKASCTWTWEILNTEDDS